MRRTFSISVVLTLLVAFGIAVSVNSQGQGQTQELANQHKIIARTRGNQDDSPNANAHPEAKPGARPVRGNGITYHGGPLLGVVGGNPVSVYYIWYGNWSGNSAVTILTSLAQNIGPSSYYNINTTYYDASNAHVVNSVTY